MQTNISTSAHQCQIDVAGAAPLGPFHRVLAGLTAAVSVLCAQAQPAPPQDLSAQISSVALFYQPLARVGQSPPSAEENAQLWAEIEKMKRHEEGKNLQGLEEFLTAHPNSAWAPSLHANLGRYDYERGLYSRALKHWEAAWQATHLEGRGSAKEVGDFTFAYWTKLLASLGRVDTLAALFEETRGRIFDGGSLQQVANAAKEGYRMMKTEPGVCFKCGTFALMTVGRELKGSAFGFQPIDNVPSPVTGFSMTRVLELATQAGLDLVPAQWGRNKDLIVPSIIHWREEHYAAIVSRRGDRYKVVDPTFGRPRWLDGADIQAEASGYFIVPRDRLPRDWRLLTTAETDAIRGRGVDDGVADPVDGCANGSGGSDPSGSSGAAGLSGGGQADGGSGPIALRSLGCGGGGCGMGNGPGGSGGDGPLGGPGGGGGTPMCCPDDDSQGGGGDAAAPTSSGPTVMPRAMPLVGAPVWVVSEPYITTWLYDRPLGSYRPGLGYSAPFTIAYKQRETRTIPTGAFGLGRMWDCSWINYVEDTDSNNDGTTATMIDPAGGVTYYNDPGSGGEIAAAFPHPPVAQSPGQRRHRHEFRQDTRGWLAGDLWLHLFRRPDRHAPDRLPDVQGGPVRSRDPIRLSRDE